MTIITSNMIKDNKMMGVLIIVFGFITVLFGLFTNKIEWYGVEGGGVFMPMVITFTLIGIWIFNNKDGEKN